MHRLMVIRGAFAHLVRLFPPPKCEGSVEEKLDQHDAMYDVGRRVELGFLSDGIFLKRYHQHSFM